MFFRTMVEIINNIKVIASPLIKGKNDKFEGVELKAIFLIDNSCLNCYLSCLISYLEHLIFTVKYSYQNFGHQNNLTVLDKVHFGFQSSFSLYERVCQEIANYLTVMYCCHMLPRKDNDHRLNAIASGETYLNIQLFDPKFDILWMVFRFRCAT